MSDRRKNNYVQISDCNATHSKLTLALLGEDCTGLNGGIVKDIADIKSFMKEQRDADKTEQENKKGDRRQYRSFLFAVLGGAIVAIISIIIQLGFSHLKPISLP